VNDPIDDLRPFNGARQHANVKASGRRFIGVYRD
jgi:hypothetical protein